MDQDIPAAACQQEAAATPQGLPVCIVHRFDRGGGKEKGDFTCTVCEHSGYRVNSAWGRQHVRSAHPGMKAKVERAAPLPRLDKEQIRERKREQARRCTSSLRKSRRAAEDRRLEDAAYPVVVSATSGLRVKSRVCLGKGRRVVSVGMGSDTTTVDSIDVAISFVALNAVALRSWVGGPGGRAGLWNTGQDLHVTYARLNVAKSGDSASACTALSLVCWLAGRSVLEHDGKVAVTGCIDLRGRIHPVLDIREKLETVRTCGVPLLVIPEPSLKELEKERQMESWPEELRQFASMGGMRAAEHFVDVLALTVTGFRERMTPGMKAELLDGPQVGVGVCTGLVDDDVGYIEYQACSVGPGDGTTILTGPMSGVTRESVGLIVALIADTLPEIARVMNVPAEKAKKLSLARRHRNLHVHSCCYGPIVPSYQQGAIYAALVSLLLKRRCRADTVIFGDVSNCSAFSSVWEFTAKAFRYCRFMGYRRVVLGTGTTVSEEAKQTAAALQDDGKPLVEWFIRDKVLDVLPLLFQPE